MARKSLAKLGIRKLSSYGSLFGVQDVSEPSVERKDTPRPTVNIVRYWAIGNRENKDNLLVVLNGCEFRRDASGEERETDRQMALGMPGGVVDGDETPLEAIMKHEKGEVPYEVDGAEYLFTETKVLWDRIEKVHFFAVLVDEEKPCAISEDEAREIKKAVWMTSEEIQRLPRANTASGAPHDQQDSMYTSHQGFYYAVEKFLRERKAASAT